MVQTPQSFNPLFIETSYEIVNGVNTRVFAFNPLFIETFSILSKRHNKRRLSILFSSRLIIVSFNV